MKDVPKPVPPTIGGGLSYPSTPCTELPYMPTQPIRDPVPEPCELPYPEGPCEGPIL